MRIMYLDHYAGSPYYGMEFRPYYMAREWVKSENEVVVVAADFSHLRIKNPDVRRDFSEKMVDGVRYLWVKTPRYRGNGLGRVMNVAAYYFKLRARARSLAKKYRPDAVIASSTYPFDAYLASRIAFASGGRFYFEIHDLWPLTQLELYGLKENNPMVCLMQRAEDFAFKNSEKIVSVLPRAYLHMEERGVGREKFIYIPNGVAPQAEPADPGEAGQAVRLLRESGKFIVMYAGGFATANALEEFVDAAPMLPENAVLVLVGGGEKKGEIAERCAGQKNVVFLGPVQKPAVPAILALADCLYLGARRCGLYRYGTGMNKLYDYMLAGKPVIYGVEAPCDPVGECGCGLTIPPQDSGSIAAAVKKLMAAPEKEREEMGERGRSYVLANHDYAVLAQKFLDTLR